MLRAQIKADREELARIARLCKVDYHHVGWMQDAMDKNKLGLPTTVSQAKCLGKMHRIKSKLTGCQLFKDDKLVLFRTLPDVPTGGNLTMTIVAHMFNREDVRQATDVYINVDGASDNICYHFIYGLAHLLRCAVRAGWPLRTIHFLRFKVLTLIPPRAHKTRHILMPIPRCCRWDILIMDLTGRSVSCHAMCMGVSVGGLLESTCSRSAASTR